MHVVRGRHVHVKATNTPSPPPPPSHEHFVSRTDVTQMTRALSPVQCVPPEQHLSHAHARAWRLILAIDCGARNMRRWSSESCAGGGCCGRGGGRRVSLDATLSRSYRCMKDERKLKLLHNYLASPWTVAIGRRN